MFYLGKSKLDNAESINISVLFFTNRIDTQRQETCFIQAERAMYFELRQGRYHNISIQCQLKLFDSFVLPVLLYGSLAKFGDSKICH